MRSLRDELQHLQEQGSHVAEVVKPMDKKKVLVKVKENPNNNNNNSNSNSKFQVQPEGKFVVDLDKSIDMAEITPNKRVALKNDSYMLHKILPSKVK